MKRSIASFAICSMLFMIACADAAQQQSGITVTEIDSVLHVTVSSLDIAAVPEWRTDSVFTTASTGVELFYVSSARFVQGDRLAVANSGNAEILLLDGSGALERRIGRKGEGPGEFQWIGSMDVDHQGDLIAYDPRLARLSRFDPTGEFVGTTRLAPPNRVVDLEPLTLLGNGRIAAVYGQLRNFAASGERRDTTPLMLFESDGSQPDTIGLWPATEWAFARYADGATRAQVGFGRTAVYAGRTGTFAIGSTDTIDVSVFGSDGVLIMRVTGGVSESVTDSDVEAWREELLERRRSAPEEVKQALAQFPYRATYPGFQDIVIDDRGRLWIGSYARPARTERVWLVLESNGNAAGRVRLPASARVLDVAGDRIAIVMRNEFDVESIAVLRLVSG